MWKDNAEADKRTQIIKAGLEVFSEKGFHPAKMEDIARRAGVGKGTVYEYFKNKEALFEASVRNAIDYYIQSLSYEISKPGTMYEKTERMYRKYDEMMTSKKELKQMFENEFGKISKELKQWIFSRFTEFSEELEAMIKKGQQSGELKAMDARIAARMILCGLSALDIAMEEKESNMEEAITRQIDLMWGGFAAS